MDDALPHLDADLHAEDDDGNNWAIVALDAFDPELVYPGALVLAGRRGAWARSHVIRTELHTIFGSGDVVVLVTFFQVELRTLTEALSA